ncbi:response regulator [Sphingobacterium oryzagri]|uniref:Response regulator n=1 Tax=Sphingobacterium oryzagri TaxID=3025669 RepID=A0ABY7WHH8_9SPHI|nr:response regulator [Sphingobacterium sp. KACC 22765]WDF66854.1 response regulator [Sphingobacterium sp. KACC 22765]
MKNKVFVCDDDTAITDMLEMLLETTDLDAVFENDSVHAYTKIKEFGPQVLVIDLWMPVIAGDQLIRRLRKSAEMASLYILCISASRDGEDIAMDAGADAFLAKPFDMDEFIACVEKGISRYSDATVDE